MPDSSAMNDKTLRADLVLSGGGVKFIGLVGAIVALMDAGYSIERVSGVSGGSVVGAILAAASQGERLSGAELRELALSVPLPKWRDPRPVPVLGKAWGLLRDTGLYRGDFAHDWIRGELANLGVRTWGELKYSGDNVLAERRYRAVVSVTDLTTGQLVRLPWDYQQVYGLDPDEQPVADAVRASMAVPFFFRPATLTSAGGIKSILVDGGVLSNFPIDSFDRRDGREPLWPTFGITVVPELTRGITGILPALKPLRRLGEPLMLERLLTTMMVGHDRAHMSQPWVSVRTIEVHSADIDVLDFDASPARLERLYDSGYAAASAFLETWDFPAYLEHFRRSHYPDAGGR